MTAPACRVCGGDGWLPELPEGDSTCPYCKGTGRELSRPLPRIKDQPKGVSSDADR